MENLIGRRIRGGEKHLKVFLVHKNARVPCYMTAEAAAADVYSCEKYSIKPGESIKVNLGIAFKIPKGYCLKITPRSSQLVKYGLISPLGLIDSDFTGTVSYPVANIGKEEATIEIGDRVGQIEFCKLERKPRCFMQLKKERDQNGFGGTGRN